MSITDDLANEIGELFGMGGTEQAQDNDTQANNPVDNNEGVSEPEQEGVNPAPEETPADDGAKNESADGTSEPAPTPAESGGVGNQAPSNPTSQGTQKALEDALAIIRAQQEAQEAQRKATPAEEPKKEPDIFEQDPTALYQYQIPQKMYNALFSEESTPEERVKALEGYAQGISIQVHNRVMQTLGKFVKDNFDAVPRVVEYMMNKRAETQSTQSSISASFYKEFPELQKPELGELVKATIRQLQKETRATAWTPAFQTAVGNRIRTLLKAFAAPAAPTPKPSTPAPSGVKPAPQVQTNDPNSSDAIADLFNSMFK